MTQTRIDERRQRTQVTNWMFDWNDLKYLLAVARVRRLAQAARMLEVDATTVARRLDALEASVGTKLVRRSKDGFLLTDAGERLRAYSEHVEKLALTIVDDVASHDIGPAGRVRIGTTEVFGNYFLAPRIAVLGRLFPALQIDLVAMPRYVNLYGREADIAITFEPPARGPYVVSKLTDLSYGLYGTRSYLRGAPKIHSSKDLSAHAFVGYIDDLAFSNKLGFLEDIALHPNMNFRSNSVFAHYRAVAAGAGLAVLPMFLAMDDKQLVRVLPNEIELKRTFSLVCEEEVRALNRIRVVWDLLKRAVAEGQNELNPRPKSGIQ